MTPRPSFELEITTRRSYRPRTSALPTVSVVVASNRSPALLQACLDSLLAQCGRLDAELIVARAGDAADVAAIARANRFVRVIAAAPDATIPQLRGLGMASATGDVVALTEDHCVADADWVEMLARGVQDGADVAGGGMDNARRARAVDWGAYFSEYGFFAVSRSDEPDAAPLLTGANVAYSRRVVADVIAWAQRGEWENVAHQRLRARGSAMRFVNTAAVSQNLTYRFTSFCADRYEHGRDYARKRLVEEAGARRWLLLASSPLLPFLLTTRVARAAAATRWSAFLRALPATFAFLTAWSVGEAVGYLRGPVADAQPTPADA